MTNFTMDSSDAPQRESAQLGQWLARSSALALAIAMPGVAHASQVAPTGGQAAADSDAPSATAGNNGQIGDIVVTARRVKEVLQDIPASVSAVTGDSVARMSSLSDIQSMVSGVTFQTYGPIPTVGIRGFGNRTSAGSAAIATVGIFQDGVFVSPSLAVDASRIDSERVEVAKGPQSTLYGRASFTGAINIVSSDPTKTFSGYLDGGYGGSSVHGENLWHLRGAISIPLSDTLSVRFFGAREKRDGFTYDPVNGNRSDGYNREIGRVRVLWQPSDALTARLTGTIISDNLPQGPVNSGRTPAPLGQRVIFGNPFNPAVQAALKFGSNVWTADYPVPEEGNTKGRQVTLDMHIKTPIGDLQSITDYQYSSQHFQVSLDLTRLNLLYANSLTTENRWSQELRLNNKIGNLSYLFGLYYLDVSQHMSDNGHGGINTAYSTNFGPGTAVNDFAGVTTAYGPNYNKTKAYAVFGQLGYDFTDKLNLTVGLREGRDELSGTTASFLLNKANFLIPATPTTYRKVSFDALTGIVDLSYKIAPDIIAYASYSRGDSPGGLNSGSAALIGYGPQKVNAYEIGLKSRLLDRHLQLDIALFDNQYSGLQLTQNIMPNGVLVSLVTNAAKAHGRGVDLDAQAILTKNFRLGLQYTYAESKITQYSVPAPPAPQVDLTGIPLVRSPRNSLNGSATYSQDVGHGKFEFTAQESYSSSYTNDYQGVPAGYKYP
jgi:iron complex outermembrane receptor protein